MQKFSAYFTYLLHCIVLNKAKFFMLSQYLGVNLMYCLLCGVLVSVLHNNLLPSHKKRQSQSVHSSSFSNYISRVPLGGVKGKNSLKKHCLMWVITWLLVVSTLTLTLQGGKKRMDPLNTKYGPFLTVFCKSYEAFHIG